MGSTGPPLELLPPLELPPELVLLPLEPLLLDAPPLLLVAPPPLDPPSTVPLLEVPTSSSSAPVAGSEEHAETTRKAEGTRSQASARMAGFLSATRERATRNHEVRYPAGAMGRVHIDRDYESELSQLRESLLVMGAQVEKMLRASLRALVERDSVTAESTMALDKEINRLEIEIDSLCLRILARRQPVASDLRFITMVLKVVTDLERMGDMTVNICERVIELNEEEPLKPYVDLVAMAQAAEAMLRDALDAFVDGDTDRAHSVIDHDAVVDAYYKSVFRDLLTYMMENPRNIYRATRVQSIAKYIERIADHATNVAEMVVFMVRGKDIRHAQKPTRSKSTPPPPATRDTPSSDRSDRRRS